MADATAVARGSVLLTPKFENLTASISSQLGAASKAAAAAGEGVASSLASGMAKSGAVAGAVSSLVSSAMGAVSSSLGSAIARVDTLNNFPRVMAAMGYSADEASSIIQGLTAHIDGLPTTLDGLTSMVQRLAPITGDMQSAADIATALNDAFLASGASTADVERAMVQYSQALAKGKPEMEDWRSLQEVMPGQLDQISKAMLGPEAGSNDLYQALKDGVVSMDDFNAALVDLDKNGSDSFASFEQQARSASNGIATALTNVQNRISKAVAKVIDAIGADNIANAINGVTSKFSLVGDAGVSAVNLVKRAFSNVRGLSTFAGAAQSVGFAVTGLKNTLLQGSGAVSGFVDRLTTSAAAEEAVRSAGVMLSDALGFVRVSVVNLRRGLGDLWDGLSQSGALSDLAASASGLWGSLSGLYSQLLRSARKLVDFGTSSATAGGAASALEAVIGAASRAMDLLSTGVQWVSGHFDALKPVLAGVAGALGSAGLGKAIASAVASLRGLSQGSVVLSALRVAVGALGGPIGLVVTAIGGLAAAFAYMWETSDSFRDGVTSAWESVSGAAQQIWPAVSGFLQGAWDGISGAAQAAWPAVSDAVTTALDTASGVVQAAWPVAQDVVTNGFAAVQTVAQDVWPQVQSAVQTAIDAVSGVVQDVWPTAQQVVSDGFSAVQTLAETVWPAVRDTVGGAVETLSGAVQDAAPVVSDVLSGAFTTVQTVAQDVWPQVQGVVQTVSDTVSSIMQDVWPGVSDTFSSACDAVRTTSEDVWPKVQTAVEGAMDIISAVVGAAMPVVQSIFETVWPAVQGVAQTAIDAVSSAVSNGMTVVNDVIQVVLDAVNGDWDSVWGDVQKLAEDVWNGLTSLADTIFGGIWDAVSGMISNITGGWAPTWDDVKATLSGAWDSMKTAVSDGVSSVVGFFTDLPGNILSALGDVGSMLWDAGSSIINGLWEGLKSAWGSVTGWFSDITSQITQLKGPPAYDAVMLTGNGELIMQGLARGLASGWGDVEGQLRGYTRELAGTELGASVGLAVAGGARAARPSAYSPAPTYNVYVNDARINDDEAMRQVTRSFLVQALRGRGDF